MSDGTVTMRAEIHDNWYTVTRKGKEVVIGCGTWLPPPDDEITARRVEVEQAREILGALKLATLEGFPFFSARVAHNNRLLIVGPWQPPDGISGIQVDRIMPDQARELIDELVARSNGPSLVGVIEGTGSL